jgi:tetratricopeptide (TPR) repeat protein
MSCPACGRANADDARFCSGCGTRLAVVCAGCGRELAADARFCSYCGTPVGGSAPAPTAEPALATQPAAPPKPAPPASFAGGRYQVTRFLGEGGKKKVYLVHDTLLDRDVAFALIKTAGLDDIGVERIKREAQVMGRLGGHPHIVSVFDMGDEGGQPFLVSELMGGGDVEGLIEKASEHRPPLADALRIADQVCQALEYAHEHGIIHRDLKPGNVWLTRDGTAKLGDFGLAMAIDRTRLSMAGMIVGTVGYMPPEQALGRTPDARADLYSLGAMLYELVTGRPPFVADDPVAVISQHINTQPVAPSWHNPAIPQPLEALILRLLDKHPEGRPASAADVRRELATIMADLSARVPATSAEHSAPQPLNPLDRLAGGVFVGRERELETLRAGFDRAMSGRGQVLLLVGEPGIGKTRLAEELGTYATLRGAQVLWGRCYEWEGAPAYWPWVQLIRGYVYERDPQTLRSELGAGAAAIAQVVSEIRERLPDLASPPELAPEQARFRFFDSIAVFLRNAAARQPLVLMLDDLHWADKPSLLLLEFLAREATGARLLLLATYRDVEVGRQHPLSQTLAQLSRDRQSERVLLRGLAEQDVARYIALTAGVEPPDQLARAVQRETEGNPFFVAEVVRLLVAEGRLAGAPTGRAWSVSIPESVREVVGLRLSRLSEACNQTLAVASVIGREFRLATLEGVTGQPADQVLELLEEAMRARLLDEQDALGHYRFSHALVRETLYGELSTARRVRLHRQVAEAIETLQAARLSRYLGELAHHYFEAAAGGDVEKGIHYAVAAGEAALANLGYEEAISHYERALQLLDMRGAGEDERRCEILLALADAQARAGNWIVADETFQRAAALARAVGRRDLLARAALGSEEYALITPTDDAWAVLLDAALDGMTTGDSPTRVRLLARLAVALTHDATAAERRRVLSDEAIAMARRLDDPSTLAFALLAHYVVLWMSQTVAQRLATLDEAIRLTYVAEDWQLALWGHVLRINALLQAGRTDDAELDQRAFATLAERLRQPADLSVAERLRGYLAFIRGDLATYEQLVGAPGLLDPANEMLYFRFIRLRVEQGRLHEMEERIAAFAGSTARHSFWRPPVFRSALVLTHAYLQRRADAERGLEHLAANDFGFLDDGGPWYLSNVAFLSEAVWLLGAATHAARLYGRLLPFADQCIAIMGANGWHGSVSLYLGYLATTLGRWDDAERHYANALAMHEGMGARPFAAHTRFAWADMLVPRDGPGDRERALELNAQALAAAEEMGLTMLAERAVALKVRLQGILKA